MYQVVIVGPSLTSIVSLDMKNEGKFAINLYINGPGYLQGPLLYTAPHCTIYHI
jgi:hypothetical protein